jgi:predicted ATPase
VELILENARCFHSRQQCAIRPLTLLVGENSTGKSTFLALMRIASDMIAGYKRLDFNEEPFQLGAYDQIATFRGGRAGRAKSFLIGLRLPGNEEMAHSMFPPRLKRVKLNLRSRLGLLRSTAVFSRFRGRAKKEHN